MVEDHATNQLIVKSMLRDLPIEITVANNGLEGFEAYEKGVFDLVLMDIQMPIMDGMECTEKIRHYEESTKKMRCPIMALTANVFTEDHEKFKRSGLDRILTKPVKKHTLINAINKILLESQSKLSPR